MTKRRTFSDRVAEMKDRLKTLSTDELRARLMSATVTKEAAIACRDLLNERDSSADIPIAAPLEIREDRPLSAEEEAMLRWLLSRADPRGRSFLPQMESARVVSRCGCGCASVAFSIDGREPPVGSGLDQISHDYYWTLPSGGICSVFVFAKNDQLAGLEVWSVDGVETPAFLPRIDQLRATSE